MLKSSLKVFISIGLALSFFTAVFSSVIATVQGNKDASLCYLIISPSILIVSVISCFRGYYQGFSNMRPTAVSQILEQSVKLVLGLSLCYFIKGNVLLKACLAVTAVTSSELITLIYFLLKAKKSGALSGLMQVKAQVKPIYLTVIPMMAIAIIIPLIRTVDSFLIINILSRYLQNATELYGILTGAVESVVSLPVSCCYALAISSIPVIAKLKKQGENYSEKAIKVCLLTLVLGGVLAILTYLFAPSIINILYGGLTEKSRVIAIDMLKVSSISIVLLSLMQTSVACINATGKFKVTLFSGIIAGTVKIILSVLFLSTPKINIFGVIYSDIVCYFVACFINLGYSIYIDLTLRVNYVQNYRCRIRG